MTRFIPLVHNLILAKMEKEEVHLDYKEALSSVLQECEMHMKTIEQQLEMCQIDHRKLQDEITQLMEENGFLFAQLKAANESKITNSERSLLNDPGSEAVNNLKDQLALALDEKQTVEGLWKASLEKATILEEKLLGYQSGKELTLLQNKLEDLQRDYTEAIQILESQLSAVRKENDQLTLKSQLLENQLIQVTSQMTIITEKNLQLSNSVREMASKEQDLKTQCIKSEEKFTELNKYYQADKVKFARIYEYERVESQLKEKLETALRERDELQATVERCHKRTAELLQSAAFDRSKIEEAVALAESAIQARDEGLAREEASTREVKRLKRELIELLEVAGQRVEQETAAVRDDCEKQLTALRDQLEVKNQECWRKNAEVEQLQRECERLQLSVEQGRVQDMPSKRDKQLNKVYSELHYSESECLQLKMENESMREAFNKLQDRYSKISREKLKLKQELVTSQQQLQLCQHELSVIVQRAEVLNSQLYQTDLELARLQSETVVLERDYSHHAEPKVSVANTLEFYKRLDESYGQMNKKWKNEMTALTDEFETKLKKLKRKNKRGVSKQEKEDIESNHGLTEKHS